MAARVRAVGRHEPLVLGLIGSLGFLALWQAAASAGWINPAILSDPLRIAHAFVAQLASGQLIADAEVSATEFAIAFAASLVLGIALGLAMGVSCTLEYTLDPFMWFLYSSPLIVVYPLIVVWLGFGFRTVVMIAFLLTVVSIVVNTVAGVRGVDPALVQAVRVFGGNRWDVVRLAVLPSAAPMILAGVRIGLSRTLHGAVLGEMFGSNAGLGFRMTVYGEKIQTSDVFVPLVIFVVIGVCATAVTRAFERRLQSWR